jgi:hypothetical protein
MADQISHKYKCIFIHIPKTAGNSIERTCLFDDQRESTRENVGGHLPARKIRDKYPDKYSDYFKFTVVRNPYDKLLSCYYYLKQADNIRNEKLVRLKKKIIKSGNFHNFCRYVLHEEANIITHLKPQTDFICDENGAVIVDYIAKLENLKNDVKIIENKLGVNLSIHHRNPSVRFACSNYYNDNDVEIVSNVYCKDISMFGYKYEQGKMEKMKQNALCIRAYLQNSIKKMVR